MRRPSATDIKSAMASYRSGDRPWPHPPIDWFIASDNGDLFPLKYTYALAVDQRPGTFTTNQAKGAMRHLELAFISLKSQVESEQAFQAAVAQSLNNNKSRAERLAKAPRIPAQYIIGQVVFRRNPDVVAAVLERANGQCEICSNPAPFLRASNQAPFLEVHHTVRLADGGQDTVDNALAACPNCHRKAHHG
jgi:5-methylcytosine-specific restriction enzyme A